MTKGMDGKYRLMITYVYDIYLPDCFVKALQAIRLSENL